MSPHEASPADSSALDTELPPGTVVGGRFEVLRSEITDTLGSVLRAKDTKTGKNIALRVLAAHLAEGEAGKAVRKECRVAAGLSHPSIVTTYGVGSGPDGTLFIATESIDGTPLSAVLAQRKAAGKSAQLSLRGAYTVVAHVCKALAYAQAQTCHGALRPSVVWVSRGGRMKVGEFGVAKAVVERFGAPALGVAEQAALAPEVKGGSAPTSQSDIFGLGAILYQLLTGRSPAEGFVPPSQAHPDATKEIDAVLMRCLAVNPSARFASPDDLRTALLPLVANAPAVGPTEDFGIPIDVDADLAAGRPQEARMREASAAPREQSGVVSMQVGARVSLIGDVEPGRAEGAAAQGGMRTSVVDLGQALARITENDAPRFMYNRAGLDHGPISGRDLVAAIVAGEVLEDDYVLNTATGERKALSDWEDFAEFVAERRLAEAEIARKAALDAADLDEKRTGNWKVFAAAAIVAVLALAAGGFWYTREAQEEEQVAEAGLSNLYDVGEIDLSGSADLLPVPVAGRARNGRSGRQGARAAGGSGASYEDAMNRAVDLGDITAGGSERQLTSQQVAAIMNRHVNRIYRQCVPAEKARGGSLGRVQIDIAIAGSGAVLGASARQGSGAFKACISGAVRSVHFPSFGAPRMGARYSFNAD